MQSNHQPNANRREVVRQSATAHENPKFESISVSVSVSKQGQLPAPNGDSSLTINHDQSLISTIGDVFKKNREQLSVNQVGGR